MNKKGCNLKKILIGVSVGVMILASVVGVYLYVNRFDASKYVQAVLDVSYKNKTTLYQEVADVSEKEAKAVFEKNLDATMQGFDASDMPDSLKGKYRELFGEIAKKVNQSKYEKYCYITNRLRREQFPLGLFKYSSKIENYICSILCIRYIF